MKTALLGLALLTGVTLTTAAHAAPAYTFETVDSFALDNSYFHVTGILQGQTTPSTHDILVSSANGARDACQRMLAMSIARPGRYRVIFDSADFCTLARR